MASRKRILIVSISACGAVLGVLLWGGWCLWALAQGEDLGSRPAGEVFKQILSIAPPSSVETFKIAGYANLGGGNAWMRLHVVDVDAALNALKRHPTGLVGPDKSIEASMRPAEPIMQKYLYAVQWENVKRIQKPEYYAYSAGLNGTGWQASIVVDRERNLLFIAAQLY